MSSYMLQGRLGRDFESKDWHKWLCENRPNDLIPETLSTDYNLLCYAHDLPSSDATRVLECLIRRLERPDTDRRFLLYTRWALSKRYMSIFARQAAETELESLRHMIDADDQGQWGDQLTFDEDTQYPHRTGSIGWFGTTYLLPRHLDSNARYEISIFSLVSLNTCYKKAEQPEKARACVERAFSEIDDNDKTKVETMIHISEIEAAQAKYHVGDGRNDAAIEVLERATETASRYIKKNHPGETPPLFNNSWFYLQIPSKKESNFKELQQLLDENMKVMAELKEAEQAKAATT